MSNMDSSFTGKSNYKNNHLMISQGGERKVMKKILSVALSTAMAFSMFASVAFGESGLTDVNAQYNYLKDKGIFSGFPDGQAHLDRNMTRAEFAKVITKTLGLKEITGVYSYNDKNYGANHWAAPYVEAVTAAGIMEGKNTTKKLFDLSGTVTVQEMATVLVRALDLEIPTETNNTASAWAKGYVQAAINAGLVDANANFQSNATRELLVGAAYAVDQEVSLQVQSYTVSEGGKVVEFKMSNGQSVKVTLDQALDANKETAVKFTYNGKEFTHNVTYVVTDVAVESVSAINATQIQVKFNQKVDEDSAETHTNYTFTSLDGVTASTATKAELSEDGLSVVVTVNNPVSKRYQVKVTNVESAANANLKVSYDSVVTFAEDTTAPTITGTERISSNKVKIKFSEPVNATGANITAKYSDGTAITGLGSLEVSASNELVVDMSSADVTIGKDIVITFNGVTDTNGNLLNPQPATVTVKKEAADNVLPAISSITQSGAKEFTIKFNKDLDGFKFTADGTEVSVTGNTVTGITKVSASEYKVTVSTNLDGLQTVTVKAEKAVDLAGQKNSADLTKLVTFKADTAAPKATAQLVVGKDNKEYVQLTFDKDVQVGSVSINGTSVKNYVTTDISSVTATAVYADGTGDNKKVVNVPLTDAKLAVEGAVYNLKITSTAVQSLYGVAMDSATVTFTRGTDGTSSNSEIVSDVAVAQGTTNDLVTVTFTIPDGSKLDGASATNLENYSIAGAEIESVTLAAASGTSQVATLKLKSGSNTFTGVRNITIKNVKVAGSTKVMEPKTIKNVSLKENVAPTVVKAELTAINKVTLTFSEPVKTDATTLNADFALEIGGATVASNDLVKVDSAVTTASNTIEFTLEANVTAEDITKGLALKVLDTLTIADEAGNKVSTTGKINIITE